MATAGDIVNRAARRIGMLANEEALTAAEMTNALEALNSMMFAFGPMGIGYVHSTLLQGTTVNMPDEQIRNLMLMFCKDLAQEYPVVLPPDLQLDIERAKGELQAAYLVINPAVPDRALRRRRPGWFDFRNG